MSTLKFDQNNEFHNNLDNQNYYVKNTVPNEGVLMINKQTQEQKLIPESEISKLQLNTNATLIPVMKTSEDLSMFDNEINETVNGSPMAETVTDHLEGDIDTELEEIQRAMQSVENDIEEIVE